MKKAILQLFIFFVTASAVISLSFPAKDKELNNEDITKEEAEISETAYATAETPRTNTIFIKEYNEKIGIFRKGAGKPFLIIETFVFTLPPADMDMLSCGFTVPEEKLSCVMEDYTG